MNMALPKQAFDQLWGQRTDISVLTFALGVEIFAIEACAVQEIMDIMPETPVPGANPLVASVFNYRGRVIPLADIRPAFGMAKTAPTIDSRFMVVDIQLGEEAALIGIRTDRVFEVTSLAKAASEPPPSIGMRWRADFIACFVKRDGQFIIIPDLQRIFTEETETAGLTASQHQL